MTLHNLPLDKFERAELDYENGGFNVICFTSKFNYYTVLIHIIFYLELIL